MAVISDKFIRVEYSEFSREGHESCGLLIPAQASYSDGVVERMFTEITGLPGICIERYSQDSLYDSKGVLATDENGIVGKFVL